MTTENDATALIIEDDDDIRRLLEMVLAQVGVTTVSAATGEDGIDLCREKSPTLVTVDIGLPDIEGIEVVRRVREFYSGKVAVISARSSDQDRAAGLAAGADEFLTKPFRPRELRSRIGALLES